MFLFGAQALVDNVNVNRVCSRHRPNAVFDLLCCKLGVECPFECVTSNVSNE